MAPPGVSRKGAGIGETEARGSAVRRHWRSGEAWHVSYRSRSVAKADVREERSAILISAIEPIKIPASGNFAFKLQYGLQKLLALRPF